MMLGPARHAHVETDVVDAARPAPEEDEIADLERGTRRHLGRRVVLVLGHPGERDPGRPVGRLDQPRAVETHPNGLASPHIGRADLLHGPLGGHDTRHSTPWAPRTSSSPRRTGPAPAPRPRRTTSGCRTRSPLPGRPHWPPRWRRASGPPRRPRRSGHRGWAGRHHPAAPARRRRRRSPARTASAPPPRRCSPRCAPRASVDWPLSDSIVPIAASTVQGNPGHVVAACWYSVSIAGRNRRRRRRRSCGRPAAEDRGGRRPPGRSRATRPAPRTPPAAAFTDRSPPRPAPHLIRLRRATRGNGRPPLHRTLPRSGSLPRSFRRRRSQEVDHPYNRRRRHLGKARHGASLALTSEEYHGASTVTDRCLSCAHAA